MDGAEEEDEPKLIPALEGQETILVVEDDDDVRMFTVCPSSDHLGQLAA